MKRGDEEWLNKLSDTGMNDGIFSKHNKNTGKEGEWRVLYGQWWNHVIAGPNS